MFQRALQSRCTVVISSGFSLNVGYLSIISQSSESQSYFNLKYKQSCIFFPVVGHWIDLSVFMGSNTLTLHNTGSMLNCKQTQWKKTSLVLTSAPFVETLLFGVYIYTHQSHVFLIISCWCSTMRRAFSLTIHFPHLLDSTFSFHDCPIWLLLSPRSNHSPRQIL